MRMKRKRWEGRKGKREMKQGIWDGGCEIGDAEKRTLKKVILRDSRGSLRHCARRRGSGDLFAVSARYRS